MTTKNFRVRRGLTIAGETTASTSIAAPDSGSDQSYTLPTAVPAVNGYVLASQTDGTMSWVANPDTNTTYTIDSTSTTGGANLNLNGSDSTTDSVAYLGSGATTVTRTDANTITIASTDNNTTYDFNATSTTGGANLNLVGSDATTDTVKLTNGGYITATYTSGTEVTLGSNATDAATPSTIVARDASGNFAASGATLGAVTVGVDTDQTISTTSGNLVLQTAAGVNAGNITLFSGAGGNIALTPDTTGDVHLNTDNVRIGDNNATATLATRGTGNLVLTTNEGSAVEGTLTFANGANGSATFAPNGTGSVALTLANGGNLTNTRNYVFGAIRNATTQSIGDIWALNATGTVTPFRGVSLDNSADTTKGPGTLMRSYSGGAVAGSNLRGRVIFEKARGTAASPTAIQAGDFLGSVDATGYTSTGWLNDNIAAVTPAFFGFTTTENWVSNTAIGTAFGLSLAPSSTTITSSANLIAVLALTPQASTYRADTHTFQAGKSGTYGMMDLNGNRANFTLPIKFPAFLATAVNGTLATTAASGTGSVATLTFGALASAPFTVGSQVVVAGVTPAGYNGTVTVTACTTTSVSYTSTATGAQTVAGTVKVAGSVGWQIAISDSPVNGGKMAYWDTTNSRFSYIDTNLAV